MADKILSDLKAQHKDLLEVYLKELKENCTVELNQEGKTRIEKIDDHLRAVITEKYKAQIQTIEESIRQREETLAALEQSLIDQLGGWSEQLDMISEDFDQWKIKRSEIKNQFH